MPHARGRAAPHGRGYAAARARGRAAPRARGRAAPRAPGALPAGLPAVVPVALLAILLAACGQDPEVALCTNLPGEAPVRGGQTDAAWGAAPRGPDLHEVWRAGGLAEEEHLAMPVSATLSSTGMLAIPDFLLSAVVGLDPDGSWRGPLLPPGQGPGELTRPVIAAWDTVPILHVVDVEGGKVERWDPAGARSGSDRVAVELLHRVVSSGEVAWMGLQPGHAVLVREDGAGGEGTARRRIVRQAFEGGGIDTILAFDVAAPSMPGLPAPGWPPGAAAADARGRLALASEGGEFLVTVLDADLEPLFRICRDEPALPLDGAERAIVEEDPGLPDEMRRATLEALSEAPHPPTPAAIGRLVFDAEGRLWVQRERPRVFSLDTFHGVPGAEHLVFDRDGSWLGRVRLPEGASFQSALGDTIVVFETGDLGETSVVAYTM